MDVHKTRLVKDSLEAHGTSISLEYVMVRWKTYDTAETVPLEILNLNHRTSAFLLALQDTNPRNHSLIKGPKEKNYWRSTAFLLHEVFP